MLDLDTNGGRYREAAVVWGPGEPFVMEQVQVDPPQKKEVRIKILFTSICHTDLSAWKGEVYIYTHYVQFYNVLLPRPAT